MKYQLAGEDEHTFKIRHPDGSEFHIAKNAVGPGVHKRIKALKMADGGEVPEIDSSSADSGNELGPMFDISDRSPASEPKKLDIEPTEAEPKKLDIEPVDENKPILSNQLDRHVANSSQAISSPAINPLDPNAGMGLAQQSLAQQEQAVKANSAVQQQEFQRQSKAYEDYAAKVAQADAEVNKTVAPWQAENNQLFKSIQDGKVDPNRMWHSMGTGNKVLAAISIALSGIGSGLTGQKNMAMDVIDKSIDRDIESQKIDLGKKQTLFSENLRRIGDTRAAAALTKSQLLTAAESQIHSSAARINSAQSQQQAQVMLANIQLEKAKLQREAGIRQLALQGGGGDPSALVPHIVPEKHQEEVFKEIERAQDTRRMGDSILKSFDEAAKKNTVVRTGAGFARTPAEVLALHQAMQPTFKDLEGTVRQAAMDNTFKNITPMPGDFDSSIKIKREALIDYLKSKASAPRAKGFGIDLDKFGSTTTQRQAQPVERQTSEGKIALFDPNTKKFLGYK